MLGPRRCQVLRLANLAKAMRAPMAIEAVQRIDEIFAIERELNGEPAERRRIVRQARVRPLVEGLESGCGPSEALVGQCCAKAMDYMVKRWTTFSAFLDDGRICLTNNAAERALRGIASEDATGPSPAPTAERTVPPPCTP